MSSSYTKLSQKEFKIAYANRRTASKTLKKEAEIKKLFDTVHYSPEFSEAIANIINSELESNNAN